MKFNLARPVTRLRARIVGFPKQQRFAAMLALNDTAYEIRRAEQVAMKAVFDRPRPVTLSAIQVQPAGLNGPEVRIAKNGLSAGFRGGAKGLFALVYASDYIFDSEKTLGPEVFGGGRTSKASERRFTGIGVLPAGWAMVPSTRLLADSSKTDAYGNVRGTFVRRLLSYFAAFNSAGFTANSSQRTKDRLAKRGRSAGGFATIDGVVYFISRGLGERTGARGWRNGREQHLPAGIWAKRGIHGSDVWPVFLFVRPPRYGVRLRFHVIAETAAQRSFPQRYAARMQRALATAR